MIKYIGQHIFDFIARFRNDVYLEDIADGTVENDKFLGLDSTGKIVKEAVAAGVTISDSTANTDFPVVFHDESNNLHDDTATFTYNPSTGNTIIPKIQTAGNIELGHASDTTVARSAAGKVTIEGNEIQTTNKHIVVIRASFHASSTSGYYLTIGGGTTGESSALASYSFTNVFNCPYDGQVIRAAASTQSTGSKTTKLEMYINKDDSNLVTDQRGSDWNISKRPISWCADSPGDWTFRKGENIAIRATDSAAVYGTQYTVVLEFDLTT